MPDSALTIKTWSDVSVTSYALTAVLQTLEPMIGHIGPDTSRYDISRMHGLAMAADTLADRLHNLLVRMEEDNVVGLLFDDRGENPGQVPELTPDKARRIQELWTQT